MNSQKRFFVVKKGTCLLVKAYVYQGTAENTATDEHEVLTEEEYNARRNQPVVVKNLLSKKSVTITMGDLGTASDPSQERYFAI